MAVLIYQKRTKCITYSVYSGFCVGAGVKVKVAHKTGLLMAQIPQLQSKSHTNKGSSLLLLIYQCALMIF